MQNKIRVTILEDHAATIEGYRARLGAEPDIEIVSIINFGEDLEHALLKQPVDILILDMRVLASQGNPNPYPTIHLVPKLLDQYPDLSVLVYSMYDQRTMIKEAMQAGASGYILKDDHQAYNDLGTIIRMINNGGMYLSPRAREQWQKRRTDDLERFLAPRQLEALSLCAAYPNESLSQIAKRMNVAHSTIRVSLSDVYSKLEVNTRTAAVVKARQIGLLPPSISDPDY